MCDQFEKNLEVVGSTAIEDKLQENVPETIRYLLEMGIKVWMITGDKQATAINIGISTKLIDPSMQLAIVNATSPDECRKVCSILLSCKRHALVQWCYCSSSTFGEAIPELAVDAFL